MMVQLYRVRVLPPAKSQQPRSKTTFETLLLILTSLGLLLRTGRRISWGMEPDGLVL